MTTKNSRDLAKTTTDRLFKLLDTLTADTFTNVRLVSDVLAELKSRGETHPLMRDGVFRWYQQIASGQLDPSVVFTLAGIDSVISRLIGLPEEKQKAIAAGGTLSISERDEATGTAKTIERNILQMTVDQLDLVFEAPGKIRSIPAQEKIVMRGVRAVRRHYHRPVPYADVKTGEIVIAIHRYEPKDLVAPLKKLGYKLVDL